MKKLLLQLLMLAKWAFYGFVIQCFSISLLLAHEGAAQNIKSVKEYELKIEFKENSIFEVFNKIEQETGYYFVYDKSISNETLAYSKKFVHKASVADVLMDISEKYNLKFRQINKSIVVMKEYHNSTKEEKLEVVLQSMTITGKITSADSPDGLPGVNVLVKGTSQGTVTDVKGSYSIDVQSPEAILVFSSIGYVTEEVTVGDRRVINLDLAPDVTELQEIVVTGYTEQRKKDITGAVTVVDAEKLNTIKAPSFAQKLEGRAPGLTTSTSGSPGDGTNIRIRGISSFTNSDPLIIIDGIQVQGDKALNGLNPNDIESMQILKDAAAASIYGARASNGVIIITTKQGKSGKMQVTYDGYAGVQTAVGGYNDFLIKDPLEYAEWHVQKTPSTRDFYGDPLSIPTLFYHPTGNTDESTYNYPANPTIEPRIFIRSNPEGTDWWDEVFEKAFITNHNVSISGGGENATYSASVDYFRQDGTMKYTYFERYTGRINSQLTNGRFTLGESASLSRSEGVFQAGGNQNEQNVMTNILKLNSIVPVYDIGGHFASAKTVGFSNGSNPLAMTYRNKDDKSIFYRALANFFVEFKLTDYLKAKSSYSIDFSQNFDQDFTFPTWENREFNGTNFYAENHHTFFTWTWTNSLQFNKLIADDHNISAIVGYEAVKRTERNVGGQVNNFAFTSTDVRYLNLTLGTYNNVYSDPGSPYSLISVFGKVDYSFRDKYLASFTFRRDGSSNFSDDNRYGNFPAFSLGWRLSEESFMNNLAWIEDLKLRGGWGIAGNQVIPQAFNAYSLWGGRSTYDANYNISGDNTGNSLGFTRFSIGNPDTGWEENRMTNVGLDASFFKGRINVVLDVYKKDITGLLFNPPLPGAAGNASQPYSNVAHMTNKGWDLSLNYRGEITSDLSFDVGLNLSRYKNKILSLDGSAEIVFPGGVDKRFGEVNAWKVGHPISGFYGYTLDGIFQNAADTAALDQPGKAPGRFRWKDLNNDGQINDEDKGIIGSPHPDLTAGLNLGLNYKRFDFTVFLYGTFGADIYNYNRLFTHFGFFNSNISTEVLENAWTGEGSGGTLPAIDGDDSFSLESSTFYIEDGTYVRAKNITLGYTFPQNKIFRSLRLYVQAQNLFTISDYSGIDPALSNVNVGNGEQNDGWTNFDFGNYPSSKIFTFGVNAAF